MDIKLIFGYDDGGTRMEVENGLTPNEVFEMIKELIDNYIKI